MFKQVFLINQDLKMGKGKIAVQVAHGEVYYINEIENSMFEEDTIADYYNYQKWLNEDDGLMKKVVLKSTEEEMNRLVNIIDHVGIWCMAVYDRGLTQVTLDSFTCLVMEPLPEDQCNDLFSHLKLL